MREIRSSGSVEGVVGNHDPYSDCLSLVLKWMVRKALWETAKIGAKWAVVEAQF